MSRPKLVYVAPCLPAEGGSGIAMRCGLLLESASRHFDVHLAVVPLVHTGSDSSPSPWVRSRVVDLEYFSATSSPDGPRPVTHPGRLAIRDWRDESEPSLWSAGGALLPAACRAVNEATRRALAEWVLSHDAKVVLVSRLSVAALLAEMLSQREHPSKWILDIDDHDSQVALQMAGLLAKSGDPASAFGSLLEAQRYSRVERTLIEKFDATFVAAAADVERISPRPRCGHHEHVPNAVNVWPFAIEEHRHALRILFVGSLGYFPNVHGLHWFVREVFPRIRAALPAVEFCIAGRSPVPAVTQLASVAGVSVIANPDDLQPLYRSASVVVCPVFAGGGSRIKILEAFAAGVPVVSTKAGADGLAEASKRCLVVANDDTEMVAACLALLEKSDKRESLLQRARSFVEAYHHIDRVVSAVIRSIAW